MLCRQVPHWPVCLIIVSAFSSVAFIMTRTSRASQPAFCVFFEAPTAPALPLPPPKEEKTKTNLHSCFCGHLKTTHHGLTHIMKQNKTTDYHRQDNKSCEKKGRYFSHPLVTTHHLSCGRLTSRPLLYTMTTTAVSIWGKQSFLSCTLFLLHRSSIFNLPIYLYYCGIRR